MALRESFAACAALGRDRGTAAPKAFVRHRQPAARVYRIHFQRSYERSVNIYPIYNWNLIRAIVH